MKKYKAFLAHVLFWLSIPFTVSFFIWIFFFQNIVQIKTQSVGYLEMLTYKTNILSNFIIVFIGALGFYAVYYIIAPKVLKRAKVIETLLLVIALFIATYIFLRSLSFLFPEIDWLSSYVAYPILLFFSAIGALFRVWEYGKTKDKENAELKRKTLETQLNLLKTQINPHFLFNTINNIDVLIENNPKAASDYLRKLGDLLRFMLYRVNERDMIPLEDEIEYLKKYIDLQKIRSINPKFVDFTIKGDTASITIAPMVFIVFVENAFKHVADKKQNRGIGLCIEISARKLFFKCRNTVGEKPMGKHNKEGGIGLASVESRLDLMYKDNYELNILSENGCFEVTLEIALP